MYNSWSNYIYITRFGCACPGNIVNIVIYFNSTINWNPGYTGIGGAAGGVVAGAIFTLPALYILHLDPNPVQTVLICLAGGCLGVLFVIPLRHYFVSEMHGQFPFPEATAITEVLVTGEKGGA